MQKKAKNLKFKLKMHQILLRKREKHFPYEIFIINYRAQ